MDPTDTDSISSDPAAPPRTFRNLIAVTGTRVALLGGWLVVGTILLSRTLGKSAFGRYTLAAAAIRVVTGIAGDPIDAAVMRAAPLHIRSDRPRALAVFRSAFLLRGVVGLVSVIVAAIVPWAISWAVFDTVDHRHLAVLTAAGVLGDLLLRSALGYFQVAETFGRFLAVDVVWQGFRMVAVGLLLAAHQASAEAAVAVYVGAPYVAFAAAVFLLPRDVTQLVGPGRPEVTDLLHAAKWIAAATAVGTVYERLDLFLLGHFRGVGEVGLYGAAMTLAAVPDFIDGCVQTVLAPRVAPAFAAGTFNRLNRQYLGFAVPLGLLATLAAVGPAGWMVRRFLTAEYARSVDLYRLLVLGTMFNLIVTPLASALVNYVAPRAATVVTAVGLAIVAIGGVLLIPRYGAIGAAGVIVAARVVVGAAVAVIAMRLGRAAPA